MTKEELQLVLYENYIKYSKLGNVSILSKILKTGLKRAKDLMDTLHCTEHNQGKPDLFILHFNLVWKDLTKEEKLNIKNYDNRN